MVLARMSIISENYEGLKGKLWYEKKISLVKGQPNTGVVPNGSDKCNVGLSFQTQKYDIPSLKRGTYSSAKLD